MTLHTGDCLDVMPTLAAGSVDAVVTDPPYNLTAFGGTRTVHRMTCAIEDAGWVIRDVLVWAYAQGFPKSRASLKPAWEPIAMARKPVEGFGWIGIEREAEYVAIAEARLQGVPDRALAWDFGRTP